MCYAIEAILIGFDDVRKTILRVPGQSGKTGSHKHELGARETKGLLKLH